MQIRGREHNSNKSDTSYVRTYPKKNWKIYKALVYYRTRARKNRKITFARDSIKESYQLGQDIKDNPEQWNLLSNIIQVTPDDVSNMVKTAKEAALEIQDQIDLAIKQYNSKNKANVSGYSMYFSDSDRNKWMQQNDFSKDNELTKGLNSARKEAQDILTKDYSQNVKSWDDLLSKYAEYEYKKTDIQKTAAKERLTLVKNFGNSDEYRKALDLSNQIQISQDPETIARLQNELVELTGKVSSKNLSAKNIDISISNKYMANKGALDWENFTNTDLYKNSFEDMDRISLTTIKDIMRAMDELKKNSDITFSPEQMKSYMKAYNQVRETLSTRAPFESMVSSMKCGLKQQMIKK